MGRLRLRAPGHGGTAGPHLFQVPPELRNARVRVTATLEAAAPTQPAEDQKPLRALKELRKLGAFKEIGDPIDWQRAQRRDRPLPGRE